MSTGTRPPSARLSPDWMAINWVMSAISIAIHVAVMGKQTEIAAELSVLHEKARQKRDQA
jgi:hypothetical protein